MTTLSIKKEQKLQEICIQDFEVENDAKQLKILNEVDQLLKDINKNRYQNATKIIKYLKSIRAPELIDFKKVTLFTILNFFQMTYVSRTFTIDLQRYPEQIQHFFNGDKFFIKSVLNNLPHLIGISSPRNEVGEVISKAQPREFLNGVLYQWLLLNSHDNYKLDFEKLEVFAWIHQTLLNPTYILLSDAINKDVTKFHADLIFIRAIYKSSKYSYHLVGLKKENIMVYNFMSQFAIKKENSYRLNYMFDTKKAIYDFYENK